MNIRTGSLSYPVLRLLSPLTLAIEHFSYRCRRASKGSCGLSLKKGHAEGIFAVHSIRKNALALTFSLLVVLTGCGAANLSHVSPGPDTQPTVAITPNAVTITAGASSTLAVTATNATQVLLSGSDGTTYTMPGNGATQAVSPSATTTYTATATGAGGKASANATVTVNPAAAPPSPTVTLASNPASIAAGGSSTLTVTATNATQVTVSGTDGTSYTLAATGGTQAVSPSVTTTYTATAAGAAGTKAATANAIITVVPAPPVPPPAPTVTMVAAPGTISMGSSSTLTVAAANATQVTITGSDGSSYTLQANGGTQAVSPAASTTYTATATGPSGTTPATAMVTVTVVPVAPPPPPASPTVSIAAAPASITAGASSTLTVVAANAAHVTVMGTDGSSYTLQPNGGTQAVSPRATTNYTASAVGAAGTTPATATATVTVTPVPPSVPTVAISASPASITAGASSTLTVTATNATQVTISGSDGSSYMLQSSGGTQAVSPAATATYTARATGATGTTPATATATVTVTTPGPSGGGVNILTFHADAHRSGLNAVEQTLTPTNVHAASFGKLFSYLVDGYVYGTPLLVSNVTLGGATHNVLYAATENDSVYAFDADSYGTGASLWHVSLLQSGETPQINGPIKPYQGVTSTPVIDLSTKTIYLVSAQVTSGAGTNFRLHALDLRTGAEKFGGPVAIHATVPATNTDAVNGIETLNNSCIQRAALLLANNSIYMGFGSCHSGWLLSYDATTLAQTGVFNASPNLNGEGPYASAGGVWMGGGGPVADDAGNVYAVTGNGPWDGQTAFADSVLKFNAKLQLEDFFTPQDYQYMDCDDADLAAGGLMMIPGTSQLLAGGKTGRMYLVNGGALGHEQANDAGATQTLFFESDRISPYANTCMDSSGANTATVNSYEIFGTAAYFNGAVYLGVTPTSTTAPAGVRRFAYNGKLTPVTACSRIPAAPPRSSPPTAAPPASCGSSTRASPSRARQAQPAQPCAPSMPLTLRMSSTTAAPTPATRQATASSSAHPSLPMGRCTSPPATTCPLRPTRAASSMCMV
jgi:hypothetical protein